MKEFLIGFAQNVASSVFLCLVSGAYAWIVTFFRENRKAVAASRMASILATMALLAIFISMILGGGDVSKEWIVRIVVCGVALSVSAASVISAYLGWERSQMAFAAIAEKDKAIFAMASEIGSLNDRVRSLAKRPAEARVSPPPPRPR